MSNNEFALENIVSDEEADAIENLTTHPQFPWNYCAGTILPKDVDENPYVIPTGGNPFQFTHTVNLENCPYVDTIRPVLNAIATQFESNLQIIKVKFNLLTRSTSSDYHLPHTDIDSVLRSRTISRFDHRCRRRRVNSWRSTLDDSMRPRVL